MKRNLYLVYSFVLAMVAIISVSSLICSEVTFADEEIIATPVPTEQVMDIELTSGDLNRDDKVNAADALIVLKHAANIEHIAEADIYIADVNQDEKVNASDALEILKFSAGITDTIGKNEVIVPDAVEVEINREMVQLVKVGGSRDEEAVEILTSKEDCQDYVERVYEKYHGAAVEEALNTYSDDFFKQYNLMAVIFYNNGSGQYQQEFSKLLYDSYRDLYSVCVTTYTNTMIEPDTGTWCVFIPVEKSISGDINYKIVVEYDWEEGTYFFLDEERINLIKIGQAANIPETVVELKTYDEYVEYVNNMISLVPEAFDGKVDEVLTYYNAEYFEKSSLAAVYIEETETDDYEMTFLGCIYSGGKYCYKFNGFLDEGYTAGTAGWCLFAPVPKGYIRNDDYQLGFIKTYEHVCDTDKSDIIKIDVEDSEDKWYSEIILIDTFEEFSSYYSSVEKYITEDNVAINNYKKEYFDNNVLVLVKYVDASYSIESSYGMATEYEDSYNIYIEKYIPDIQHEGLQQWDMLIPLEGKQWNEKKLALRVKSIYEEGIDTKAKTMWISTLIDPSNGVDALPQYYIISSYEEYNEYIEYIKLFQKYTVGASYREDTYNEKYFDDNVLLLAIIDGSDDPYDAKVVSKVTDDGQIILDIDRYHNNRAGLNGRIWNIFVPLQGKDWSADNIIFNFTDTYQN